MFGAPIVSADFVRHAIAPSSEYSPHEDALVNAFVQHESGELLKTGKTFVVDGSVNSRAVRSVLERAAAKHGYGKMVIWVQTDEPTSVARSLKRSSKRKADELNAPMKADMFERYKKQLSVPTHSENVVVISGKHTFPTQARVILKKLVTPRDTVVTERSQSTRHVTIKSEHETDVQPRRRNVTIN